MLDRFTEFNFFERRSSLKESMTTQWKYPAMLWHKSYYDANGYAGSARHEETIVADSELNRLFFIESCSC